MIKFTVYGRPATAGSKRAIPYQKSADKGGGLGVRVIHDNKRFTSWAAEVKDIAVHAANGQFLLGPIELHVHIYRKQPANHFTSKSKPSSAFTEYPTSRPDTLKIVRALEDALTGVLWKDDSQVVHHNLSKYWGQPERVEVVVRSLDELASHPDD